MFRITNNQTRQQETCKDRDDLLSLINEQSVWAADRQESFTLTVEHLTEDQTVIETTSLILPLQDYVEEVFAEFGKKEKKNKPWQRIAPSKKVSEQSVKETKKEEPREAVSAQETQTPQEKQVGKTSWVLYAMLLLSLFISIGGAGYTYLVNQQQVQTIKNLENRLLLREQEGKIEVTGRYFLSTYYSGDTSRLESFLASDLPLEAVSGQRLLSVMAEDLVEDKKQLEMTFVVTTQDESNATKTSRITLTLQEEKNSTYGYVLVKEPKISNFKV